MIQVNFTVIFEVSSLCNFKMMSVNYIYLFCFLLLKIVDIEGIPPCLCTEVTQCYPYIYSMSNVFHLNQYLVLEFWRDKFCGYSNGMPKVCCDILPPQGPINPTVILSRPVQEVIGNEKETIDCREKDSKGCVCISLPRCEPYAELARTSGSPLKLSLVKFFKSKQCGFENNFPKVCCPSELSSTDLPKDLNFGPTNGDGQAVSTEEPTRPTSSSRFTTKRPWFGTKRPVRSDWDFTEKSRVINQGLSGFGMFELMRKSPKLKDVARRVQYFFS